MDTHNFQDPPKEYREVPFWSWNDRLDPDELRRQVELIAQAGWGGFFMHARVGLRTAYLGPRWMECLHACVEAARERGLGAWLYDEDKWPSGFAGGLSVAANPTYRAQCLVCKVDDRPALLAERIAVFRAREVDGQLTDIHPDPRPSLASESDRLIQFYPLTMPLGDPWFNGYAYLDLLNLAAVRAFLDSTHERYAHEVGADFGSAVPGIFTDEPCALFRAGRWLSGKSALPWTHSFADDFRAQTGYDLLPQLPTLFFDAGDFHQVRYDYWRSMTKLFVASYTRQLHEWCDEHRLIYTGHYMAEDRMLSQIEWLGAVMPHYAFMHYPGIDKLERQVGAGCGTILTVKQLDSVVCQTGKARALCENYGCAGQDFAHTGRKWIGDWAYVLGINLNNPHLSLYSMRGERKRDYPANLYYQQPWWPENRLIADYFARLSYVLSQGQRVVDILVIHPIGSAWALYRPDGTGPIEHLDQQLDSLLRALLSVQRDFHLGDEMLMEVGGATEGQVRQEASGACLTLGRMAYRVVIVPPGITLARNTLRLLHEFAAAGGAVLAIEPVPTRIDGRLAGEPLLPASARIVSLQSLPAALDEILPFDVRIPDHPAIWAHHRRINDLDCYFLVNTDEQRGGAATVYLRGTGQLEMWSAVTGERRPWPSHQHDGLTEVVLDFPPVGSHMLMLRRNQPPTAIQPQRERVLSQRWLADEWELSLLGPNALTLDTAQVRLGAGAWSEPMPILQAHARVAESGTGTPFGLRFTFHVVDPPATPIALILESPERFAIHVNGQHISSTDLSWWVDISFRKSDISAAVQTGINEIVLEGTWGRDLELESVYIVGAFGVAGQRLRAEGRHTGQVFDRYAPEFFITTLPARIQARRERGEVALDLTAQGLPFFAGRVVLRQTVMLQPPQGRVRLECHNLRAAVAHVRVNGELEGTVAWPPHSAEITSALRSGRNVIEIELVGTLRNLLGPHHRAEGDREWTGPNDFRDAKRWTDDYILVPFGFDEVTLKVIAG